MRICLDIDDIELYDAVDVDSPASASVVTRKEVIHPQTSFVSARMLF